MRAVAGILIMVITLVVFLRVRAGKRREIKQELASAEDAASAAVKARRATSEANAK